MKGTCSDADFRARAFWDELSTKIRRIPGVTDAALNNNPPLSGEYGFIPFIVYGQPRPEPDQEPIVDRQTVSSDYFSDVANSHSAGPGLRLTGHNRQGKCDRCGYDAYCVGMAASMGSFLLAAGTKGKRYALPNCDIMLHQPSGATQGMASDVQRSMEQLLRTKQRINRLLAFHTGKSESEILRDIDRDRWLSAEEAKDYGIIDEVVASAALN